MKKVISLFLSIVMLVSAIACVDLSAYAVDSNNTSVTTINIEKSYEEHMLGSTFAVSASYCSDTYAHNEDTISYEISGNNGGLIIDGGISCIGTKEDGIVSIPLKAVKVGSYTVTLKTIDGATDSITIVISNESYDIYLAQEILKRNSFLTATDTIIKSSDYGWMQSNEAMIYFNDLSVQEYVETMIIRVLIGKAIDEKNIFESYAKATSLVTQCMSGIKGIYSTITEETTFDSINDESIEKNIKDYVSGFYKFNVFDTLSATIKGATTISQAVKQASYYRVISDTLSVEEISNMLSVTASSIYESEYRNTLVAAFSNIIDIVENTDLKISEHFANAAIDYGVNTLKSLTLGVAKAFAFNSLNAVAPGLGSVISAGMTVYEICKAIDNLSKNKLKAVEINLSAVSALCEVFKNAITSYAISFENNPDKYAKIIVENYKYLLTADRIAVEIQQENIDILSKSLLDSISVQPAFSLSQLLKNIDLYGGKSNPLYSQYLVNERYPVMLDTLESIIDNEYLYVKTVTEDYLYYSYGMDLYEYTSDLWDIETKYIITLDSNYADANNSFKKEFLYYTEGESLDERCMPFLRPGYDFLGWYTNKECTKEYDMQKSIQSNLTLYAKWSKQVSYRNNDDGTATVTSLNPRQSSFSNVQQSKEIASETVLSKINEAEAIVPLFVDGKSIVAIDSNAISSNCSSVYIHEMVENIATDAINKSTVIYCWPDSYAHQFAKDNGYEFILIDSDEKEPDAEETPAEYFTYIINNDEVTITGLADGYNPSTLNIPSKIENKNVTRIGNDAFEDCKSMTSVTIPNSVISIGYAAFEYCTKLENINISDNVTSIGEYAFYRTGYYDNSDNWSDAVLYIGKHLIKSKETVDYNYVVKDGTLTIADGAFYSCTNLSNLIISDSTTSIGKKSIWYCANLTNLSIPCSTEVSEDGIRCENISNITITKGTGVWANHKSYNGKQPWNREGCTVTLEDGIESIGDQAFRYCNNLIEITIPNSVTSIGSLAFFDCENLSEITFPNNNSITISYEAFAYCYGLEDITLCSNNIDIDGTAFLDCKNIESINISGNVTNINGSFGLDNLQKTNYIGTIEQWAELEFASKGSNPTYYSKNLYINDELISEIEINNVTKINPYAFGNCTNLKKCIIGNNITSIGEAAFEGCSSLEEITLPFVGYSATDTTASAYTHFGYIFGFEICYDDDYHYWGYGPNDDYSQRFRYNIPETLKSVTITGGKILPDSFRKCETLTNITLPNNITCIENSAFEGCTSLVSIIIPDGVTNIGEYAFYGCSSLQSVALPCSVESSWAAFSGCNNVKTVTLTKGTGLMRDNYYSGQSWPWCSSDEFDVYVENGVTNIGGMTFVQGKSLVNIYLSDTVKSINYQAFAGCSNLKEIDLCNVQSIESSAFSGCINLENIRIPDTIKKIYSSAFTNTYYYNNESNWKDGVLYIDDCLIEVRDSASDKYIVNQELKIIAENAFASKDCSIIIGDFECKPVNESAFAITQYRGNTSDLIIPDQFFGYDILNIKKYAFHNCSSLESITIPNSVIEIDTHAFECCSNLTEILVLPKNTSYCSENGVLFNKDKTNLLRYPCAKTDKNYVIPDSVTDISKGAFFDNDKLECLTISKNVKRIALDYSSMWYSLDEGHPGAFYNNKSLKRIIWNAERCYLVSEDEHFDLESPNYDPIYSLCILASFFPECTEFIIGDEVKYIPCLILANNQNIKSINISDSVASIGVGTFYNCTNLEDIYFSGTKAQWSNVIINDGNDLLLNSNIHCTDGTICKEHNWNDGVVKVIPTCKEKGQLLRICLNCGATKTEEIPMQHNLIDGICGTCGMLEEDCIESSHPYANNFDNTWTINKPNAKRIAITFSESTETESCDYIYLYDSNDNQIGKYSGTELAGKRVNVKGDTVKIRLVTDSSVTYYGFSVTNVQVYYDDCTHSKTELRNEKTANCANSGYTGDVCCVECDEVINKGETIPKTNNHNMGERVVEPTCSEQGYTEYYCCDCNHSYKTDYIPATGIHTYVNGFCKDCKAKDPECVLPVINSGESQTVEIKSDRDYYYVTFTPKSNGTCTFSSIGNYDTYGYLYDENMNELTSNDDGGDNYNFSINYDLQVGRTYIFACRMLNSDEIGTFNVTLEFDEEEHEHSYVAKTIKPTCTAKGYTTYICECGNSYVDNYVNATGHKWNKGKATKNATCSSTGVKTYTCTKCKATKTETLAKTAHTYKTGTTKATISKNGSVITKCSVCDNVSKNTTIYYPKTITLSKTSYTYNGKTQTPTVTVKGSDGKVISSNNYTVTYQSGRKNVGKYSVKITFKGNYSGSKTLYFTINPKATTLSSVTAKSKGFTVKWKKQATQTTGYEIQYATDSKFTKNKKTVTVSKNKTTSKTISKLKAKKKYYVRIRTYKTVKVNGKSTKIYSSWGKSKTITTKK